MPRVPNSLILIIAIVSGLAAFIISLSVVQTPRQAPDMEGLLVVTAIKDIPIGTMIGKGDVDLLAAPKDVNPKALFTEFNPVVSRLSRKFIRKGWAIRSVDLYNKGENLASLIPPGYRAMSIPVTMSSNLAKLVFPGNRVDVILTYRSELQQYETVILVKNARVIDVTTPKNTGESEVRLSVTLAVTSEGARTLAFAMEKGTLKVSVRPLDDIEKNEQERFFTLKELFYKEGEVPYKELVPQRDGVEVIRGLRKEKRRFDRGKDGK